MFQHAIHAKRLASLANATLGVMVSGSLIIHWIGQGLAEARGLIPKYAIKQVDRLLSNIDIDLWTYFVSKLAGKRNDYEDELLVHFHDVLPPGIQVTVLADRGFGDHKLLEFLLAKLGFGYVIRIRGNIGVTSAQGETRAAASWLGARGRAKLLRQARITAAGQPVATVVCVWDKDMKTPWCLVASDLHAKARTLINYYAKRWGIEPSFRDTKDLRFGLGLSAASIS